MDDLTPKHVRVRDRDDIGDVIQWGKNLGSNPAIYCAVIYFPQTGGVPLLRNRPVVAGRVAGQLSTSC